MVAINYKTRALIKGYLEVGREKCKYMLDALAFEF